MVKRVVLPALYSENPRFKFQPDDSILSEVLHDFPQSLQADDVIVPQIKP
jgi:hypothetical protein